LLKTKFMSTVIFIYLLIGICYAFYLMTNKEIEMNTNKLINEAPFMNESLAKIIVFIFFIMVMVSWPYLLFCRL